MTRVSTSEEGRPVGLGASSFNRAACAGACAGYEPCFVRMGQGYGESSPWSTMQPEAGRCVSPSLIFFLPTATKVVKLRTWRKGQRGFLPGIRMCYEDTFQSAAAAPVAVRTTRRGASPIHFHNQ